MDPSKVYLIQTDTTVGLASQNKEALAVIKQRESNKPFIVTVAGCKELKRLTRAPKKQRKLIRRAKKTTFVYPHKKLAVRVIHDGHYYEFLKPFGWMYSTSANKAGEKFDIEFSKSVASEIVGNSFKESAPSKIVTLGKKMKKLR
jgi:tRNA A37 threonylcarbamoyladenosine synthetase subunit TsaC/SUA5/YrdC